jgi:hypothetical protein
MNLSLKCVTPCMTLNNYNDLFKKIKFWKIRVLYNHQLEFMYQ